VQCPGKLELAMIRFVNHRVVEIPEHRFHCGWHTNSDLRDFAIKLIVLCVVDFAGDVTCSRRFGWNWWFGNAYFCFTMCWLVTTFFFASSYDQIALLAVATIFQSRILEPFQSIELPLYLLTCVHLNDSL